MRARRYEGNPILEPKPEHDWESENVFNPAAIYDHGLFHILYRAMGRDGISRIGYAVSTNGYKFFRFDQPVFTPRLLKEPRGCEDPRVVKIGDSYFMTYTAYSENGVRIGLATTKNFIEWERYRMHWPEMNTKNAVLFPEKIDDKFVMLHRPMEEKPMGIWISYSDDLTEWYGHREVMAPGDKGTWEGEKIGAGAPPIKIDSGWLLIYHGVDENWVYRLGAVILCLDDPSEVLYRYPNPILQPEMYYEVRGTVPRVVFACGVCEVRDKYYIYYGAADRVICVATMAKKKFAGKEIDLTVCRP